MEEPSGTTTPEGLPRRQLGLLVLAGGALLLVVSALAEPLGLGAGGGWGWKQYAGVAAGAVGVLFGLWLAFAPPRESSASGDAGDADNP